MRTTRPLLTAGSAALVLALSLACGGSGFGGRPGDPAWTQADVRAVALAQGWTVEDCYRDQYGGSYPYVDITCTLLKGDLVANVWIYWQPADTYTMPPTDGLYKDETSLEVTVSDSTASAALRDLIVPQGRKVAEMDRSKLTAKLTQNGWTVTESSEDATPDGRYLYAAATKGDLVADINLGDYTGSDAGDERYAEYGSASVMQGEDALDVTVTDKAQARPLIAAFE